MELQHATVLVTGATGNMGPYLTDQFVDSEANVISTYNCYRTGKRTLPE